MDTLDVFSPIQKRGRFREDSLENVDLELNLQVYKKSYLDKTRKRLGQREWPERRRQTGRSR